MFYLLSYLGSAENHKKYYTDEFSKAFGMS